LLGVALFVSRPSRAITTQSQRRRQLGIGLLRLLRLLRRLRRLRRCGGGAAAAAAARRRRLRRLLLLLLEPVLQRPLSLLFLNGVPLDLDGLLLLLLPLKMLPPLFLPEAVGVCRAALGTRDGFAACWIARASHLSPISGASYLVELDSQRRLFFFIGRLRRRTRMRAVYKLFRVQLP
jgi:hypothetical protein